MKFYDANECVGLPRRHKSKHWSEWASFEEYWYARPLDIPRCIFTENRLKVISKPEIVSDVDTLLHKKLCYRRRTARRSVSVEILSTTPQQVEVTDGVRALQSTDQSRNYNFAPPPANIRYGP